MFKRFIDNNGIFEVMIPVTWKYILMDNHVHTFEDYNLEISDSFQLSITEFKDEAQKNEYIGLISYLPSILIEGEDFRYFPDNTDDFHTTKMWTTIFAKHKIVFSLTFYNGPGRKLTIKEIKAKVGIVFSVIDTLKLIADNVRVALLNSYRFEMFLQGMGASVMILKNAIGNKAFIEAICILANQIDSLLRIAIVLKNQLINKDFEIEQQWIYQGATDKKKSEKDIYKASKELGIIDDNIFNALYKLYDDRNRVIHRFIISEITLAEVEEICCDYYETREEIKLIVDNLETEQVDLGIGMTTMDESEGGNRSHNLQAVIGKIGRIDYFLEMSEED